MTSSSPATTLNESLPPTEELDLEKADAKVELPSEPAVDPFLVQWDTNDPDNPLEWQSGYRWRLTIMSASQSELKMPSDGPAGLHEPSQRIHIGQS
jgi:hypothetical protein